MAKLTRLGMIVPEMRLIFLLAAALALAACTSTKDTIRDDPADAAVRDGETTTPGDGGGSTNQPRTKAHVYFVGHSLVNHQMPEMLQDIARELGVDHERYGIAVRIGGSLQQHWDDPSPAEGRACDGQDGLARGCGRIPANLKGELGSGDFDVVVLTERIPLVDALQFSCTQAYALEIYNLAVGANPNTQVYYYETWYWLSRTSNWPGQIATDRQLIDQFIVDGMNTPPASPQFPNPGAPSNCPHANPPTTRANGANVLVVPAGRAMTMLVAAIEAGTVPGISAKEQLFADDIHLSELGNYFIALVMYSTIYKKAATGAPTETTGEWNQRFAGPSAETSARLVEIAWDAVTSDPRSGVTR